MLGRMSDEDGNLVSELKFGFIKVWKDSFQRKNLAYYQLIFLLFFL